MVSGNVKIIDYILTKCANVNKEVYRRRPLLIWTILLSSTLDNATNPMPAAALDALATIGRNQYQNYALEPTQVTQIVELLLARGYSPYVVPADLIWTREDELQKQKVMWTREDEIYTYVENSYRHQLEIRLTPVIINLLRRAHTKFLWRLNEGVLSFKILSVEKLQALPEVYIGQQIPCEMVLTKIMNHFSVHRAIRSPLVFMFAGHSGHGKTMLAKELANKLFHAEPCIISCGTIRTKSDLFGSARGYKDSEKKAQLSAFLESKSGHGCCYG